MADPLSPPQVVGPISPCNTSIRVQNQLIGSTVAVLQNANPTPIAGGPASWPDQTFDLKPGVVLNPNDKITATQSLGGPPSAPTPQPVIVQQKPTSPLGAVTFASTVLECARALVISGAIPGGKITLTDATNHTRGTGIAEQDGTVVIAVNPQLGHGEILQAAQSACGLQQPTATASPAPVAPPNPLPAPVVEGPLYECDQAVTVSGATPGATVTLTRTQGPTEAAPFGYSSEYFRVPALKKSEVVSASGDFPNCDVKGAASNNVTVGPPQAPKAPAVVAPLCAGGRSVRLTNLTIGATVEIFQNGAPIGQAAVAKSPDDFNVSTALVAKATIWARQSSQCQPRQWSVDSNKVTVDPSPPHLDPPDVPGPLFECGCVVHVTSIHPGALVEVFSAKNGLIGFKTVYAYEADIPVAPQLTTGDKITAQQSGCGKASGPSNPVVVQAVGNVEPPVVEPLDSCMRSVRVTKVIPGALVEVFVDKAGQPVWLASATSGTTAVDVALPGQQELTVQETITARQRLCSGISKFSKGVTVTKGQCSYVTQHFDNGRTGWNRYEGTLTVDSVLSGFGQIATLPIDGQTFAQPLFARDVAFPGSGGRHNVLFVATATDWIYAFDTDGYQTLWAPRQLVPNGGSAVPYQDVYAYNYDVQPYLGIMSTPVIDPASNIVYLVATAEAVANDKTTVIYNLHAIDLTTGQDRAGSPVSITARYPPNADNQTPLGDPGPDAQGFLAFDPAKQMQRPGLLLAKGTLYVGFASHGDNTPYHGWVLAYDPAKLTQIGCFNTTPDQMTPTPPDIGNNGGGIWQSGMGIAADDSAIYFSTGNGPFNANLPHGRNYGDAVVKLPLPPQVDANKVIAVADYFAPWNQYVLEAGDLDLASGGLTVIPGLVAGKNLLVQSGKSSVVYVLDRGSLGKYAGPPPNVPPPPPPPPFTNHVVDDKFMLDGQGVYGGPAYCVDSAGKTIVFYCGSAGHVNRLTFDAQGRISLLAQTATTFSGQGDGAGNTLTVSSNGSLPGTAIVWLVERNRTNDPPQPGDDPTVHLFAFDAENLKNQLCDLPCGSWSNKGTFIEPTVADGKVFVATEGQVAVFGLSAAFGPA